MSREGLRALRVAELIRPRFAEVARKKLDDPALAGLVVSSVKVSDDLSVVDIGVRFLAATSPEQQRRLITKLRRALPRLTRGLLAGLDLRRAPELRVHYDEAPDARARVEELLDEIQREPKARDPE